MSVCVFCEIGAGKIPAEIVYRDEHVMAVHDINPQAPSHLVVFPLIHYSDIAVMSVTPGAPLAELLEAAAQLGDGYGENGFRLVVNAGVDGGQTVKHVHIHVLAGRAMSWPPG